MELTVYSGKNWNTICQNDHNAKVWATYRLTINKDEEFHIHLCTRHLHTLYVTVSKSATDNKLRNMWRGVK